MIRSRRRSAAPLSGAVLGGALGIALLLGGCSGPGGGAESPGEGRSVPGPGTTEPSAPVSSGGDARPLEPLTDPTVLEYCPAVGAGPLDGPTSQVEAVYICASDPILSTGGGAARARETVDRVVEPADLLEAYTAMDEPATPGMGCTFEVAPPLIIWLDLGDEVVPVRPPVDGCNKPTAAAQAAYQAAKRVRVFETAPAGESGEPDPGMDD